MDGGPGRLTGRQFRTKQDGPAGYAGPFSCGTIGAHASGCRRGSLSGGHLQHAACRGRVLRAVGTSRVRRSGPVVYGVEDRHEVGGDEVAGSCSGREVPCDDSGGDFPEVFSGGTKRTPCSDRRSHLAALWMFAEQFAWPLDVANRKGATRTNRALTAIRAKIAWPIVAIRQRT